MGSVALIVKFGFFNLQCRFLNYQILDSQNYSHIKFKFGAKQNKIKTLNSMKFLIEVKYY